jgi:hypothetical protein
MALSTTTGPTVRTGISPKMLKPKLTSRIAYSRKARTSLAPWRENYEKLTDEARNNSKKYLRRCRLHEASRISWLGPFCISQRTQPTFGRYATIHVDIQGNRCDSQRNDPTFFTYYDSVNHVGMAGNRRFL